MVLPGVRIARLEHELSIRLRVALRWCTRTRWRWLLVCLAIAAIGLIPVVVLPTNSDVAWLLYAAERVLEGATLYEDVIEINPPLIVWLSLPPVVLADMLGVESRIPFLVYVVGLVLLSLRLTWSLLDHLGQGVDVHKKRAYLLLLVLAMVALPGWVYGQREHIMVLLVTPYLMTVSGRLTGGHPSLRTLAVVGVLGGFGFALKPYFLPAWVGLEILYWFHLRKRFDGMRSADGWRALLASVRRPEFVCVVIVGGLYAGAVLVLTPEFFDMAARLAPVYVGVPQTTLPALLTRSVTLMAVFALGTMALYRLRGSESAVAKVFTVALAVWLIGAIGQLKGWWYHFYPALAAATVVLVLVIGARRDKEPATPIHSVIPFVGVLVLAGALGGRIGEAATAVRTGADFDRHLPTTTELVERHSGSEGSLAVISPHIHAAFPLVNRARVGWGLRFNAMWVLEVVYAEAIDGTTPLRYHAPEEMEPAERYLWESTLDDLTSDPPEVLLLDRQRLGPHGFDYRAYFGRDERFRRLMARCELIGEVGRYRAHRCRAEPANGDSR